MSERTIEAAMPWLFVAAMIALWQLVAMAFALPAFVLPRPVAVAEALGKWTSPILTNAGHTLLSTLLGFVLAVAMGTVLGVAIGASRLIYRGLYPVLIGFNSVGQVAV